MQEHIHTVVQHIFQKQTLQEVAEQELQQFVAAYPYSTIGQLLLAEKLQQSRAARAQEQAQKTSLYFHNPLWLHWQLTGDHLSTPSVVKNPAARKAPVTAPPVADTPVVETPAPVETAPEVEVKEEISVVLPEETTVTPQEEEVQPTLADETIDASSIPDPVNAEPAPATPTATTTEANKEEAATVASPTESPEPIFEPYHTIDYFASQGIKLKLEDLSKDKLGQQLKSFTEWLRGMKKIPVSAATMVPDETGQQVVQEIAGHSVEGKEIVTEAMAEVWLKQGNRSKAIAIYEKLSLLNPSKKPYFAARIEHLKAN